VEAGPDAWRWFGGRAALDLVNTVRRRYAGPVDTLRSGEDLSRWLLAARVTTVAITVDARGLGQARRLREVVNDAVTSTVEGRQLPAGAIDQLNGWLGMRGGEIVLRSDAGAVRLDHEPPSTLAQCLAVLALDAAQLVGTDQRARLRVCGNEQCGMRFYDRSRAGRRRWCSSQACGNVDRARRFRARHAADDD
jgi:predicted RNA-binding Zn ribbon-like protein